MAGALGSLVVEVAANVARFQSDMGKVAMLAEQNMQKVDKALGLVSTSLKALGAGFVIGLSIDKVKEKINGAIEAAAGLEILAQRTGATVEGLSALVAVAKFSGTETDALATALQKLSKTLADAATGGKQSAAAFSAIGISVNEVKNLKPDQLYLLIAKQLDQYADGAGKTAVAIALMGKAGANQLPVMHDLAIVGDLVAKQTEQQAQKSREYTDNLKRLEAAQGLIWKQLSNALLPTMNSFVEVMVESAKKGNALAGVIADLSKDGTLSVWAQKAAMGLTFVIEALTGIIKFGAAFGGSVQVMVEDLKVLAAASALPANALTKGLSTALMDFGAVKRERDKVLAESNQRYKDLWNYDGTAMSRSLQARFDALNAGAGGGRGFVNPESAKTKPQVPFVATEAKALAEKTSAYAKYLDELDRTIAKMDESEYASMRLRAAQLAEKEGITDLSAALDKINRIQRAQSQLVVDQTTRKLNEESAAYSFQTAILGKSAHEQDMLNFAQQKRLETEKQIAAAIEAHRPLDQKAIDDLRAQTEATIALGEAQRQQRYDMQRSSEFGIGKALQDYQDKATDMAKTAENIITGSLSRIEDAFVKFVHTGKLNLGSLFSFMVDEFIRAQVRMAIADVTKGAGVGNLLGDAFKSVVGTSGGFLSSIASFFKFPGLATGTNYVPYDGMPAILHKGEAVVPAEYNPSAGGAASGQQPMVVHNVFNLPGPVDGRTQKQIAVAAGRGLQLAMTRGG